MLTSVDSNSRLQVTMYANLTRSSRYQLPAHIAPLPAGVQEDDTTKLSRDLYTVGLCWLGTGGPGRNQQALFDHCEKHQTVSDGFDNLANELDDNTS
jgi:hypothetical protein